MKNKYIPATHISFTHTKELLNIQSYSLQLILVKFNKIKVRKEESKSCVELFFPAIY